MLTHDPTFQEPVGLYTSGKEESFREVKLPSKAPKARITFDRPEGKCAEEWFDEAQRRLEARETTDDLYDYAKIEFKSDKPICIGITGDWHLGGNIDIDMLKRDVELMAEHPLVAGVLFTGDLTDSAFFNPAQDEDVMSYEEQRQWMISTLDYIDRDRVLALWKGNHDHKWDRKSGTSKYAGLSQRYNAPVFYGNAYIDLWVNDVNYKLMGSHRLRGNSIYTNAHPAVRGHKENQGLDLTFAGHIHKKGHFEQPMREFNKSRTVYGLINGTYQLGSEYTKDSGYGVQRGAELGMYWVMFGHDRKMLRVMDTEQMIETMAMYLEP